MKNEVIIVIADDDEGHAALIQRNLRRAGITNTLLHCKDGQEVVDFFFRTGGSEMRQSGKAYLLLLDIRMPKIDGVEVLRRLKQDSELKKMPVIILTTTDDPREITHCHALGCSNYIAKPIDYEKFVAAVRQLGLFLPVVEIPQLNGE